MGMFDTIKIDCPVCKTNPSIDFPGEATRQTKEILCTMGVFDLSVGHHQNNSGWDYPPNLFRSPRLMLQAIAAALEAPLVSELGTKHWYKPMPFECDKCGSEFFLKPSPNFYLQLTNLLDAFNEDDMGFILKGYDDESET